MIKTNFSLATLQDSEINCFLMAFRSKITSIWFPENVVNEFARMFYNQRSADLKILVHAVKVSVTNDILMRTNLFAKYITFFMLLCSKLSCHISWHCKKVFSNFMQGSFQTSTLHLNFKIKNSSSVMKDCRRW